MKLRILIKELEEKAFKELNERPERVGEDINYIKDWINKQPHLNARTDDQWILGFLRGCKFSLERVKEKLDLYYTMRSLLPQLCRIDINSEKFLAGLNSGSTLPLTRLQNASAERVVLVTPACLHPSIYTALDAVSIMCAVNEMLLRDDDNAIISGLTCIVDLRGSSMAHFTHCNPVNLRQIIKILQDANPMRAKSLHYINPPKGFEMIIQIIKSFLTEKLRSRLFVHNTLEKLHEQIPKDILPEELGGTAGTKAELHESFQKKLAEFEHWFSEDSKYKTDESKRIGSAKTIDNVFGIDGSFRQLGFD